MEFNEEYAYINPMEIDWFISYSIHTIHIYVYLYEKVMRTIFSSIQSDLYGYNKR